VRAATSAKASRRARRPVNSFARRCTTSERASTERRPRSRPSRSGSRKLDAQASSCRVHQRAPSAARNGARRPPAGQVISDGSHRQRARARAGAPSNGRGTARRPASRCPARPEARRAGARPRRDARLRGERPVRVSGADGRGNKSECTAYGLRLTAYGLRLTAYGLRLTAYGLRFTVCGLRCAGSKDPAYTCSCATIPSMTLQARLLALARRTIRPAAVPYCRHCICS
jgi:hypothetical protein